jgi:hypothetical protein
MFIGDNAVGELGVLVDKLAPDGLASGCGLAAGDVLLAVNGCLCRSHAQARTLCDAAASLELVLQVRGEGVEKGGGGADRGGRVASSQWLSMPISLLRHGRSATQRRVLNQCSR